MRQSIVVEGLGKQRYDPELATLDPGSMAVTRWRRNMGARFTTPPVVAYAQSVLRSQGFGLGIAAGVRERVVAWLPTEPLFPKIREFIQPTA